MGENMKRILCDRNKFMDCVNGDLMIREGTKITALGDEAMSAVMAAEEGTPVFLTKNGEIITVVCNYREMMYED